MRLEDFDYDLPEELVAQHPLKDRAQSRLLVLSREDNGIRHLCFSDMKGFLRRGDLLVLNDTKVIPARLEAKKKTGGRVEILLVERGTQAKLGSSETSGVLVWRCLISPFKGLKYGVNVSLDRGIEAVVRGRDEEGLWLVEFRGEGLSEGLLLRTGRVPLPPYIKRSPVEADSARYQTVFAKNPGAVAAPTAGLHFTETLLREIEGMGVGVSYITLHTGPGTFLPVRREEITGHKMPAERYYITADVSERIENTKKNGRRIIAVGSTVARTLETVFKDGIDKPALEGRTGLFIYPGFTFRATDALITNFHLPRTTLMMLVSAFADMELIKKAYKEAVRERYRFFSYGDCMLIL
ncbi:MAG: tRNA preQ1(34) S-adenosylmethionine ribosyltransferase-isomerase QueA [Deltaproteobacteria bacterium]|nr:tRNA preQ1(34) S-adenosylmethionine ribosyltransferase-isomerase QueA [Deltaproteobacteria bacterium]